MIEEYRFGSIRIDGRTYNYDVEVRWDGEVLDWRRKESHIIDVGDMERPLAQEPEVIVIGTGASGVAEVTDRAKKAIENRGIKLIIEPTAQAAKTFNSSQAKAIGLFHLTC